MMNSHRGIRAICLCLAVVIGWMQPKAAPALTWDEALHGDAGELVATAQKVLGGPYDKIMGTIGNSGDFHDGFEFGWLGGVLTAHFSCDDTSTCVDGKLLLQFQDAAGTPALLASVSNPGTFSTLTLSPGIYYFFVSTGFEPPYSISFDIPIVGVDDASLGVPSPASLLLLAMGLAALSVTTWRRGRRKESYQPRTCLLRGARAALADHSRVTLPPALLKS